MHRLLLLLLPLAAHSLTFSSPHFPSHFTANVRLTSHLLTPDMQTDGYPPTTRQLRLAYDRDSGVARVDEGILSYIRRYDLKKEFKLNSGPYPSCRVSYLSESLPSQQFPRGGVWITAENSAIKCPSPYSSELCRLWRQDEGGGQIVNIYVSHETWIPLVANLHSTNPTTLELEPTLTFEWNNINLKRPSSELFEDVSIKRDDCEDQAGGFPWMHLFHHFFRV